MKDEYLNNYGNGNITFFNQYPLQNKIGFYSYEHIIHMYISIKNFIKILMKCYFRIKYLAYIALRK